MSLPREREIFLVGDCCFLVEEEDVVSDGGGGVGERCGIDMDLEEEEMATLSWRLKELSSNES